VWASWVLSQYGIGLFHVGSPAIQGLSDVGAFAGPSSAALIITRRLAGKEGLRALCRRYVLWRVGFRWYLVALVLIPASVVFGALTLPGAAGSYPGEPPLQITVSFVAQLVLLGIIGGPLAEEPGWRGFALPRLQNRYGTLKASLLLGMAWALWHLPLFLTAGEGGGPGVSHAHVILLFAQFVPATVAFTLVLTWLFDHTHGSVLLGDFGACSTQRLDGVAQTLPDRLRRALQPSDPHRHGHARHHRARRYAGPPRCPRFIGID
jgi:CAAX protease family protein